MTATAGCRGGHVWTCERHLKSLLFAQVAGLTSRRQIVTGLNAEHPAQQIVFQDAIEAIEEALARRALHASGDPAPPALPKAGTCAA